MWKKILIIIGGLSLVIAIVAAVGLGVWANQLNAKVTATQKQLASVQADLDKLKSDNTKLTADLGQTNSTLGQSKSDLAKAQTDLKKAETDKAGQRSKMDDVKTMMTVVNAIFVNGENDASVTRKIAATGDIKLMDLWDTLTKSPTTNNGKAFSDYLFGAIDDAVK
jgi:peptidoglycan hydrolase CwlO-like protein